MFYCMGNAAIVYITIVIPGGCAGHTPNDNEPYVKIATTTVIEKHMHTNPGVTKSSLQHESLCVQLDKMYD